MYQGLQVENGESSALTPSPSKGLARFSPAAGRSVGGNLSWDVNIQGIGVHVVPGPRGRVPPVVNTVYITARGGNERASNLPNTLGCADFLVIYIPE